MVTSGPEMFKKSTAYESEILKLVQNHFLPDREVLRWQPTNGGDIPTLNTDEIVVLSSFFQHEFSIPTCKFLHDLHHSNYLLCASMRDISWCASEFCLVQKLFLAEVSTQRRQKEGYRRRRPPNVPSQWLLRSINEDFAQEMA
jgi:hypothetical protein